MALLNRQQRSCSVIVGLVANRFRVATKDRRSLYFLDRIPSPDPYSPHTNDTL